MPYHWAYEAYMRFLPFLLIACTFTGCVSRTQMEALKEDTSISGAVFGLQDEPRVHSKRLVWIWEDAFWE